MEVCSLRATRTTIGNPVHEKGKESKKNNTVIAADR